MFEHEELTVKEDWLKTSTEVDNIAGWDWKWLEDVKGGCEFMGGGGGGNLK